MPSHHSHSSHSSHSSRSSSSSHHSSGSRSSFSSPSRHSFSSHSSRSAGKNTSGKSVWGNLNSRSFSSTPKYYVSPKHRYVYIPESFIGSDGVQYKKGYYDENNDYSETLRNTADKPGTITCHCPYCDRTVVYNLLNFDKADMTCPSCGGQMEPEAFEDEIREVSGAEAINEGEVSKTAYHAVAASAVIILATAICIFSAYMFISITQESLGNSYQITEVLENRHDPVYLNKENGSGYSVVQDSSNYSYVLEYIPAEDSYYCQELNQWFWYNEEVYPAIWQYWHEDISSDFGDYGWMEHDNEGWWIETSDGNWEKVPERYDTSGLIWIE